MPADHPAVAHALAAADALSGTSKTGRLVDHAVSELKAVLDGLHGYSEGGA
jgi:hypothetical protein